MTASITALTQVSSLLGWSSTSTAAGSSSATPMLSWSAIRGNVLSAVSDQLGITQADLTTQLKTGKSMTEIAKAAGVSTHDLTTTIQGALAKADLPPGVNLATMATGMANNVNNASLVDQPSTPAMPVPTASTSRGIDTSALRDVRLGGLSLDPSQVTLLFGPRGTTLDGYL